MGKASEQEERGMPFGELLNGAMRASSERSRWIKPNESNERVNARLREIARGVTTDVDDSEALRVGERDSDGG